MTDLDEAREFAESYAERSGETLRGMADNIGHMREVRRCSCDYEGCQGWQMSNPQFREPWETPWFSLRELADLRG